MSEQLNIVLDVNYSYWVENITKEIQIQPDKKNIKGQRPSGLAGQEQAQLVKVHVLDELITAIKISINCFLSLAHKSQFSLFVFDANNITQLFPLTVQDKESVFYNEYETISKNISNQVDYYFTTQQKITDLQFSRTAAALSKVLCYINKCKREADIPNRILLVNCSRLTTNDYVSLMNCVDAAKKHKVLIDILAMPKLAQPASIDSKFTPVNQSVVSQPSQLGTSKNQIYDVTNEYLQQIAYLTNGIIAFPNLERISGLMTYMFQCFLMDEQSRKQLRVPKIPVDEKNQSKNQNEIEFSTICTCCKQNPQKINIGYICSLCLAVHCKDKSDQANSKKYDNCSNCGIKFDKVN